MAKELIPAPCEHYDMDGGCYKTSCPDYQALCNGNALTCEYYAIEFDKLKPDEEPHKPCTRRRTKYADDKTVDMFKEE